jgi:hypothetical protein
MLEANAGLSHEQIEQILQRTSTDLGPAGFDPDSGYGQVNALRAVELAAGRPALAPSTAHPLPTRPTPVCAAVASRTVRVTRPRFAVRCAEAATLHAKLTLPNKAARKLRIASTIARGRAPAAAHATTKVKLIMPTKTRKRLRRLNTLRKLRAKLTVVATGRTGGVSTLRWKVRLSR